MQLYERLGIPCGVTAVIGSGGKTTLLRTLSRELPVRSPQKDSRRRSC